jgi:hypothetical protein
MIYLFLTLCFFAHFLGDFTKLSNAWMLGCKVQFKGFTDFKNMSGIAAHAAVHGILLSVIALCFFGWVGLLFGLFNFVPHFFIDCGKPLLTNSLVKEGYQEATNPKNRLFWEIFGTDQFLHACTILLAAGLLDYLTF